jgi:hypothetical protein
MKIFRIQTYGSIRFLLAPSAEPRTFAVGSSWQILNPLLTLPLSSTIDALALRTPQGTWISCQHLFIGADAATLTPDFIEKELEPFSHRVLSTRRVEARQAGMPKQIAAVVACPDLNDLSTAPVALFGTSAPATMAVQEHLFKTSVTEKHLTSLDTITTLNIHEELLVDAIEAFESDDLRKSLLFAAMACEAMAQHVLRLEYDRALAATLPDASRRVHEVAVAGGRTQRLDPVFELLMQGEHFRRLVHEAPLYMLRRSLLLDDKPLFDRMMKLYKTRNRLAHGGHVEPRAEAYALTIADARDALGAAISAFFWFGERGGYVLPSGMMKI